jgi:hypothetical protein
MNEWMNEWIYHWICSSLLVCSYVQFLVARLCFILLRLLFLTVQYVYYACNVPFVSLLFTN